MQSFRQAWQRNYSTSIYAYAKGEQSFLLHLTPEMAVQLDAKTTLNILYQKLGSRLNIALAPENCQPDLPPKQIPKTLQSPVQNQANGNWLKQTNMVGINVRTVGSFWNVVKYMLTLPSLQDCIHLLPIWEPGVVGSLYGKASWRINQAFFSPELAFEFPHLDTVEKQLKAVVNILHVTGRTVGMDVIPHCDRFGEMVLTHPQYFEWIQRKDTKITNQSATLYQVVQDRIIDFLKKNGAANGFHKMPFTKNSFFYGHLTESQKCAVLFGEGDFNQRNQRRNQIIKHLIAEGYETLPATMAPPYRGVKVVEDTLIVDEFGNEWRDYEMTKPQAMSRVFGPLTRYQLYERLDDNKDWQIDFDRPRQAVWDYVCGKYGQVQQQYNFDFMRGDMAHVQMRPEGVPNEIDAHYDILTGVKHHIQQQLEAKHFAFYAETFLLPPDTHAYGDEIDHLEALDAESTLGDLQSTIVGSLAFLQKFRQYDDLAQTRRFAPTFTILTADKDDPRFDKFYYKGNAIRLFIAYFLTRLPSYMALGFQARNTNYLSGINESYSKLYVFQIRGNQSKATNGPYVWGSNAALYEQVTRLKQLADSIGTQVQNTNSKWLLPPDPRGSKKVIAWTQIPEEKYVFVANLDINHAVQNFALPLFGEKTVELKCIFSTLTNHSIPIVSEILPSNAYHYKIAELQAGEGRVYVVE